MIVRVSFDVQGGRLGGIFYLRGRVLGDIISFPRMW